MNSTRILRSFMGPSLLACVLASGCSDPMTPSTNPIVTPVDFEDCAASAEWLPNTPALQMFKPLPHPTTECPFYRGGWQTFLIATQPDAQGRPAILSYPTIDTTFTSRFKHPPERSYLGDVKQAGRREMLIDGNGNTLYYGIHVNEEFKQFIEDNDLKTSDKLQAYPRTKRSLFFPSGVAEFKSAWQVVEGTPDEIARQTANFISMETTVPTLSQASDGSIVEDRDKPLKRTVRLLALHVVFTLPGHPEFIWASFEHSMGSPDSAAADNQRDVAPTLDGANPDPMDPNNNKVPGAAADHDYILYKGGTPVAESNLARQEQKLHLVEASQKFLDPTTAQPQQTPIYRMFPASKSNTIEPDEAITSLNHNVESLFMGQPGDKRGNYRLLGAQWMDKPDFFTNNFAIQNDLTSPYAQAAPPGIGTDAFVAAITTEGADSQYSILAGEDRMSSTAMESFTQAPGAFQNCFSCHNTRAITANGVALDDNNEGIQLLEPGLLNVSHVLSQFLLEDCSEPKNLVPGNALGNMGHTAVCPPYVPPSP